jgi:hypothetical protein
MKLKIIEEGKEKYLNVDFWSYLKIHLIGAIVLTLIVYGTLFLLGIFLGALDYI